MKRVAIGGGDQARGRGHHGQRDSGPSGLASIRAHAHARPSAQGKGLARCGGQFNAQPQRIANGELGNFGEFRRRVADLGLQLPGLVPCGVKGCADGLARGANLDFALGEKELPDQRTDKRRAADAQHRLLNVLLDRLDALELHDDPLSNPGLCCRPPVNGRIGDSDRPRRRVMS